MCSRKVLGVQRGKARIDRTGTVNFDDQKHRYRARNKRTPAASMPPPVVKPGSDRARRPKLTLKFQPVPTDSEDDHSH